jgi:peptidoglycan-associated lipoprotein
MAVILAMMLAVSGCAKTQKDAAEQPLSFSTPEPQAGEPAMVDSAALDAEAQKAFDALTVNKIYFDFDKFDLKDESKEVLKAKAEILKKYGDWKMLVEGHCDERGTEEYNLALGERRARAAYEYLVVLGVPSSRLKIVSFGEEKPAVEGSGEAAWAKNRRDEFKVFK